MLPTTIRKALENNTWYLLGNSDFIFLLKLHYCTGVIDGYWPKDPKLPYADALLGTELSDLDLVRHNFFKRFSNMLILARTRGIVPNELFFPMLKSIIAEPVMKIKDPFSEEI